MQFCAAYPPERRTEVLHLLRETGLTIAEIAARTGVKPRTIKTWNARAGWPRPPQWHSVFVRWSEPRRNAVARLLGEPGNDPADIAEALGFGRDRMDCLRAVLHAPPAERQTRRGTARDAAPAIEPSLLRAHLRAHIARQIAAFDAALSQDGVALAESARILRDLGGLKRLLDDAGGAQSTAGEGGDDGTDLDLPALRAEIARRYDGFVGGGAPV